MKWEKQLKEERLYEEGIIYSFGIGFYYVGRDRLLCCRCRRHRAYAQYADRQSGHDSKRHRERDRPRARYCAGNSK